MLIFYFFRVAHMNIKESIYPSQKKEKKKNLYISKVSDGCIRDLGFNSRLHQKLIGVLV